MSEHPPQPTPDPSPSGPTEGSPPVTDPAKADPVGGPASAPPPSAQPPRAVSIRWLIGLALIVIVSVAVGANFGGTIGGGVRGVMGLLGFGHDHNENAVAVEGEGGVQYYTCGMHPWVILPKPGPCPICGMQLTPVDPAKFTGEIAIDPLIVQNIGVRIGEVVTGPLVMSIRTVGSIDYDEPLVRDINIKVNGWIDKLNVDYLGAYVSQGQELFSLYSPELYSAQEEYLLAYRNRDKVGADFVPDAARGAADLLEAARTRLLYFDITPQQINELERTGTPTKTMTLRSPYEGVVIAKHANEGMKVGPGMQVYRIADLSKVWVLVTLYEYQLPYVQDGQDAVMTLPYIPGQRFEGKVVYIYPYLDKKTREVQVRLEFDNANGLLKPGMFANIELNNTLAKERTLVPRDAIIDTGQRQIAFVSLGEGKFEPRNVLMGIENGDGMVEVLDGLEPGEKVVTSGQFLIDSEANTREALAKMVRGDTVADQKPQVTVAAASQLTALPGPVAQTLDDILNAYLKIGDGLATDSIQNVKTQAQRIIDGLDALTAMQVPQAPQFWRDNKDAGKAMNHALKLRDAGNLEEARLRFADLSIALGSLVKATGVPQTFPGELQELHCPMYRQGQGGSIWLQPAGDVRNPFLGTVMPTCFDRRTTLPVTGGGATDPPDATDKPETSGKGTSAPPISTSTSGDARTVQKDEQLLIDEVFAVYLDVQTQLAADDMTNVAQKLWRIGKIADYYLGTTGDSKWQPIADVVSMDAGDLVKAREVFRDLSPLLIALIETKPPSTEVAENLFIAKCPMAKGGVWLQSNELVTNPYYGEQMPDCGSIQRSIKTDAVPTASYFFCGMHPWILTDEPGECPIGGEDLTPLSRSQIVNAFLKTFEDGARPKPAQTGELTNLPEPVAAKLNTMLTHYLAMADSLAFNTTDSIAEHAHKLAAALDELVKLELPSAPYFWQKHQDSLALARSNALKLIDADGLDDARLKFADLSIALGSLVKATGVPQTFPGELQELHCPMYRQGQGGSIWLQPAGDVRNPFLGTVMPTCFDRRTALPVTGRAVSPPNAPAIQPTTPPADGSGSGDQPGLSTGSQRNLDLIVTSYLSIQGMLTEDKYEGAPAHLAVIHESALALAAEAPAGLAELARGVGAKSDTQPGDLDTLRDSFASLSDAVADLARQAPPTDGAVPGLYLAYCPMVKKNWLQTTDQVHNPYGTRCGTIKLRIPLRIASLNAK